MAFRPSRLAIFIDGNNMFYAQQKNGWFFDPRRVLNYFANRPEIELVNAYWYTGLKDPQDQRGFRDALVLNTFKYVSAHETITLINASIILKKEES